MGTLSNSLAKGFALLNIADGFIAQCHPGLDDHALNILNKSYKVSSLEVLLHSITLGWMVLEEGLGKTMTDPS